MISWDLCGLGLYQPETPRHPTQRHFDLSRAIGEMTGFSFDRVVGHSDVGPKRIGVHLDDAIYKETSNAVRPVGRNRRDCRSNTR